MLEAVAQAWEERRDEIRAGGSRVAERLQGGAALRPSEQPLDPRELDVAVETLRGQYDAANGGFGSAPKFPPASTLELLMRRGEREMVAQTLLAMASGGMYDQIGGGFARYSVDPYWLVPHFEKMLYDNALLARAYLHGWQVSGDPLLRRVVEETLDWALREMRAPEGGFYSALDADSEGVEGRFYVWSVDELREALGERTDADEAIAWFGATDRGNFEGANIPVRGPGVPEAPRRVARAPLRGARAADLAGARRQAPDVVERPDDLRARRGRRGARAPRLPGGGHARGRVPGRLAARRRGPPAAHVEGRPGAPERLPRGPRLPARGAAHALRGELRSALVRAGVARSPTP